MSIHIGIAPDAWGVWFPNDPRQPPWNRFLDEVAEAGYEWLELGPYGYLPTELPVLRRELESRGLKLCACVVEANLEDPSGWPKIEQQVLGAGELAAGLGGQFLVLIDEGYTDLITGEATGPTSLDDDAWRRLIDTTQRVAEMARDRFGLRLTYHPNTETHVEHEDQIERLLDETDPDLVSLCLDLGHHVYCGGDAVACIRRHHERMPHIHFKNVDAEILQRVRAEGISVGKASGMDVFSELSAGILDYTAVRDVLHEVGYHGFAIVEKDMYPADFDKPLPIAKRARAYLREIGIG